MGNGKNKAKLKGKSHLNKIPPNKSITQGNENNLESIKQEQQARVIDTSNMDQRVVGRIRQVRQVFAGPLPDPQTFKRYNEVCPGAANRILKMAENQSTHRQEMESSYLHIQSRNSFLRIVFAFIIVTSFLGLGFYCIMNDKTAIGCVFSAVAIASIIATFLQNTDIKLSSNDNKNKSKKDE